MQDTSIASRRQVASRQKANSDALIRYAKFTINFTIPAFQSFRAMFAHILAATTTDVLVQRDCDMEIRNVQGLIAFPKRHG